MASKPAAKQDRPANTREHAVEAHEEFIKRVKQAMARARRVSGEEYAKYCKDGEDKRASNMSTIKNSEEGGIEEAVRRYGGARTGVLRVADDDLAKFLAGVRAKLVLNIQERNARVANLALEMFRYNPNDLRGSGPRASHIVTLGYLSGYKRVLELFDACFGALQNQLAEKA